MPREIVSQNAARVPLLTAPSVYFVPQRVAEIGQLVVSTIDARVRNDPASEDGES
jgi:hypothetical protein